MAERQPKTKIAARRQQIRLSQTRLAELTGIPTRTLRRIERGEVDNPPLRYLVNIAVALDCPNGFQDILEDEWLEWKVLDARAPAPPESGHWLPERARS